MIRVFRSDKGFTNGVFAEMLVLKNMSLVGVKQVKQVLTQ